MEVIRKGVKDWSVVLRVFEIVFVSEKALLLMDLDLKIESENEKREKEKENDEIVDFHRLKNNTWVVGLKSLVLGLIRPK